MPTLTPTALAAFSASNNRIINSGYDSAGNMTHDSVGRIFSYDGENRQQTFDGGLGNTAQYVYDGDGKRIKKIQGGATTLYVYNAFGNLIAEYSDHPSSSGGTTYLTTDHLGSTRVVTDASKQVKSRHDYLPFGDEISSGYGNRNTITGYNAQGGIANLNLKQKFTAKERDAESNLDYFGARYFSGAQGRFTSPDPLLNSGRPTNPETWNRYAYTLNNPLRYTDPNGLWEFRSCSSTKQECKGYQSRVHDAYNSLVKSAGSFQAGSKERIALDRVLSCLGKEGQKNGVVLAFASLPGSRGAQYEQGSNKITFDLPKLDKLFVDPRASTLGYNREAELEGELAHEGTHGADRKAGFVDFQIPVNGPINWTTLENSEIRAYSNQSYVNEATGTRSIIQLWNPSWTAADAETLRSKAVDEAVRQSIDDMKAQAKAKGKP
jgi:RHS repeat-associated protein